MIFYRKKNRSRSVECGDGGVYDMYGGVYDTYGGVYDMYGGVYDMYGGVYDMYGGVYDMYGGVYVSWLLLCFCDSTLSFVFLCMH